MYHRENAQEGFLVLAGECLLIVEEQERRLQAWDFFHCPGGTHHIIVGAGEEAAIVVAVGARGRGIGGGIVYPVSEAAARHGVSVERETTRPAEAYEEVRADLHGQPTSDIGRTGSRRSSEKRQRRPYRRTRCRCASAAAVLLHLALDQSARPSPTVTSRRHLATRASFRRQGSAATDG